MEWNNSQFLPQVIDNKIEKSIIYIPDFRLTRGYLGINRSRNTGSLNVSEGPKPVPNTRVPWKSLIHITDCTAPFFHSPLFLSPVLFSSLSIQVTGDQFFTKPYNSCSNTRARSSRNCVGDGVPICSNSQSSPSGSVSRMRSGSWLLGFRSIRSSLPDRASAERSFCSAISLSSPSASPAERRNFS